MAGIYIHIPFCASRCIYCDFYSSTSLSAQNLYTQAICTEIELRKDYLSSLVKKDAEDNHINTIYFGGGTPSLLSEDNFQKIFSSLHQHIFSNPQCPLSSTPEITVECNPDDITQDFLFILKKHAVNRISMGVQSFDNSRLKFLGRRHTVEHVYKSIELLKNNDFHNISIDLIFGFPKQTLDEWDKDVHKAILLDIQHISAYSLMYEEGTALYKLLMNKKIEEVDEKLSLDMFNLLINKMQDAGFEHYEISNFTKEGFRSRHNSNYWQGVPYLGLGASAHSYNRTSRQWNIASVKQYTEALQHNSIPYEIEELDAITQYNDIVVTALRTKEGIDLRRLNKEEKDYLLQHAQRHILQNRLVLNDTHLALTRQGIFVSDGVMTDLIKV